MKTFNLQNNGFEIRIQTGFDSSRSSPLNYYYLFTYQIFLKNISASKCKLISRKWFITDSLGGQEIVEGPGVVGKNPVFDINEHFSYSSFCPLKTPQGKMHGHFYMKNLINDEEDYFIISTPEFTFEVPDSY